jgi:hypothetical protein
VQDSNSSVTRRVRTHPLWIPAALIAGLLGWTVLEFALALAGFDVFTFVFGFGLMIWLVWRGFLRSRTRLPASGRERRTTILLRVGLAVAVLAVVVAVGAFYPWFASGVAGMTLGLLVTYCVALRRARRQ